MIFFDFQYSQEPTVIRELPWIRALVEKKGTALIRAPPWIRACVGKMLSSAQKVIEMLTLYTGFPTQNWSIISNFISC